VPFQSQQWFCGGVTVVIYYIPSKRDEFDGFDVVDQDVGMWSGRRRLAVRCQNNSYSFYLTQHPAEAPGLRTNVYTGFTPINPLT
jgi:hypothetical protein